MFKGKITYFALLLNGVLLGSQYLLIRYALSETSVLGLSALRLLFSLMFMFFVVLITGVWREIRTFRPVFQCLLLSVFGEIISPLAIVYASKTLPSSTVGLGVSIAPFITIILSVFIFRNERLSFRQLAAMLFGVLGVTMLFLPSLKGGALWPLFSLCVGATTLGLVKALLNKAALNFAM